LQAGSPSGALAASIRALSGLLPEKKACSGNFSREKASFPATLSVFWQFESLDGDLKEGYLSKEPEQALTH
jgi:hypothetical protein